MRLFSRKQETSPIPPELQQYYQLQHPSKGPSKRLIALLAGILLMIVGVAIAVVILVNNNQKPNKTDKPGASTQSESTNKPDANAQGEQKAAPQTTDDNKKVSGSEAANQAPVQTVTPQTSNQPAPTSNTNKTNDGPLGTPPL